jgi:hypothetical protein
MRILLTENSPVGMLHLSSVEGVITDFFPYGTYHDELYELKDFVKLCSHKEYDNAIMISNNSPWSDWIWTNPDPVLGLFQRPPPPNQQDVYELKGHINELCGWKPDAVINICDTKPDPIWRAKIQALSLADPNLTIICLNASDPKFAKNIIETVRMLDVRKCARSCGKNDSAKSC